MEKVKQSLHKRGGSSGGKNDLLDTAIRAISEKGGEDIVSLDLRKIDEAVADFFVLCDANNPRKIQAICDTVEQLIWDNCNEKPYHSEYGDGWSLIDYVDVVIHIFRKEERSFYDLEGLWLDSIKTTHSS